MLANIRDKAKGWVAWLLVILISIPFALWGINSYFEAQARVPVAEVNGETISLDDFQQALEAQRRALRRSLGKRATPGLLDSPRLKRQVLDAMIARQLLIEDAAARGFRISDAQLRELIRSDPAFQRGGRFDKRLYERALRNAGLDPVAFEESLRADNTIAQLRNGFVESAIVPMAELNRLLRIVDQVREFEYATLRPAMFMTAIRVSEEDVRAYYDSHRNDFQEPEKVRLQYLRLSVGDIARKIRVDEAALRQAYQEEANRYVVPEARRARHILVRVSEGADANAVAEARRKAESLRARLLDGADFAELARKESADRLTATKGGDLGFVSRGVMEPAFDKALFALRPGEISRPVRTRYGWHLIRLEAVRPEKRKPLAEVRAELEAQIRRKEASRRFLDLAETFRDLVYEQPDSLQPAADELDLKVETTDWVTRRGGKGIAGNPKVVAAAFSEEVLAGENSEVIELDPDTLVALRIAEHRPARQRPLTEVRDEVERRLRIEKARARAVEAGQKILARLRAGGDWKSLLGAAGVSARSSGVVKRDAAEGVPSAVLRQAFRLTKPREGPTYGALDRGAEGYVLIRLTRVTDGDPAKVDDKLRKRARELLRRRNGEEFFAAYREGLRQAADIVIHEDNLR